MSKNLNTTETPSATADKSAQHTPGPWRSVSRPNQTIIDLVYAKNGTLVADIIYAAGKMAEADANARLIAAAPELLEALKTALSDIQTSNAEISTCSKIQTAISKAEDK